MASETDHWPDIVSDSDRVKCKNCGTENGTHHYKTNQCPVGGKEVSPGWAQEWMNTTFEPLSSTPVTGLRDQLAAAQIEIAKLHNECGHLQADVLEGKRRIAELEAWKQSAQVIE